MARRAIVTGATGQDGSYLVEFLLGKGYEVHGLVRRTRAPERARLRFHCGDLTDAAGLASLMRRVEPDEIYNLASQSNVEGSFENPVHTLDVDGLGALRLLEAARMLGRPPRIFQAGSSEMFGRSGPAACNERSPFRPRTPYGAAKLLAYWQGVSFRNGYRLFVANGILFDHESPMRSERFVTRRITRAAARIKLGLQKKVRVGNLDARHDWGFAGDYVEAMWRTLQQRAPDDYVIATGRLRSVREFCEEAFGLVGLGWKRHVESGPARGAPHETDGVRGDAAKARRVLKWKPRHTFRQVVAMMVESDLELARVEAGHA